MSFISSLLAFLFAMSSPRAMDVDMFDGDYRGNAGRVIAPPRGTVGKPCQCG